MSYIYFEDKPSPRTKTQVWVVRSTAYNGLRLGEVRWLAPWRCYSFWPDKDTAYEQRCLRDIATFCEDQTTAYRATWPKRKKAAS